MYEEASKRCSSVLDGTLPDKFLFVKSKTPREFNSEKLSGIPPVSRFFNKSSEFSKLNLPIYAGIGPVR